MKCQKADEVMKQAVKVMGIQARVVKVTDVQQMVAAGIMVSPLWRWTA